jgi:hypothetical protein
MTSIQDLSCNVKENVSRHLYTYSVSINALKFYYENLINNKLSKLDQKSKLYLFSNLKQNLSVEKYNKVWDLIKFSTGNLPSSNLTAKFEAFFLMPRTYLQKDRCQFSIGVLSMKLRLNPLLKESFLLCQNLFCSRHLHMVFICKEYYWWDRSWYLTAPKYY